MNTSRLKIFAQQSRRLLMDGTAKQLLFWGFDRTGDVVEEPGAVYGGVTHHETVLDDPFISTKWNALKRAIQTKGIEQVIEENAYTWFNRIMAIRIMAMSRYDQPQVDYGQDSLQIPMILQRARRGSYDFLSDDEKKRLQSVLHDHDAEDRAFAQLLVGYCHHHSLLSRVFGRIDDYTELLLPSNILEENGFIYYLNTTDAISEDDYKQVELIGWLYQFYISEKKDEVFKKFKKNIKAEAEDIPAATQIFTPNWIVKYMVQNTTGRIWLDHKPESPLREKMKYLVESESSEDTGSSDDLIKEATDLKLLDPACGSGHILVEGFDLLYDMYMEEYYTPKEAVESILQHNLFGLDLDIRAVQLSRFALLLKAAARYPEILKSDVTPRIYAMPEAVRFDQQEITDFLGETGEKYKKKLQKALELMQQAQNLGSVMVFDLSESMREFLVERLNALANKSYKTTTEAALVHKIKPFIEVIELMNRKYEAVAANPPYMGSRNMNDDLKDYISKSYIASKADLMTVFMDVISNLSISHGRYSMINLPSWLFISSFEKLRSIIVSKYYIESLLHMGRGIFGIDYGSVAFSIKKEDSRKRKGDYFRLHERNFQHIYFDDIKKLFLYSMNNPEYKYNFKQYRDKEGVNEIAEKSMDEGQKLYYPSISQSNFPKIPGSPIAYWVSEKILDLHLKKKYLKNIGSFKRGIATADNNRFLRYWFEIDYKKSNISKSGRKWFKYNKGGEYRKWYGNKEYVIDWENNGYSIKNFFDSSGRLLSRPQNIEYNFFKVISYSSLTSGKISVRIYDDQFINDQAGNFLFNDDLNLLKKILGVLNSKVSVYFIKATNPTLNITIDDINKIPFDKELIPQETKKIVDFLIENHKKDWDSYEISWDFEKNTLVKLGTTLKIAFENWRQQAKEIFFQLHRNEEELNAIFIEIYGLQDEINKDILLKDITILQEELDFEKLEKLNQDFSKNGKGSIEFPVKKAEILNQLISYSVGCMMGRYRLDKPGLQIAHLNPTAEELTPYELLSPLEIGLDKVIFEIDDDGLIPLMASRGSFSDDACHRFRKFLEIVWGEKTLTENMNFLEECLGKNMEDYLEIDFWKDHCKRYKKRPIYWLFSSSNGAFQVLAYMHRMNRFTAQKVREKYLFKHIRYLENEIEMLQARGVNLSKQETKRLELLTRDLKECEDYNKILKDIADRQIQFDLDDGVKANYVKFEEVLSPIK